MVSIVLSVFMGGLGFGSWASGRWLRARAKNSEFGALRFYALFEFLIGLSALVVPYELSWGRRVLEGVSAFFGGYYVAAGFWVAFALGPLVLR